jgi:redox-sensitive bicupin YhaK (pirin superfamily)
MNFLACQQRPDMTSSKRVVQSVRPLGFPWATVDPFLFCVHHKDAYPRGNARLGPATSLAGRQIGMDFAAKDGWNMYHGSVVPGFPQHPHRGFETVTIARRGVIDHSDSLGATARFSTGDVQWMTAGKGVVHCEMFPLLSPTSDNPLELFQIWMNLPKKHKMVQPHFTMLWSEDIPVINHVDAAGKKTTVTVVAGAIDDRAPPAAPPHSWASERDAHVAIWSIVMEAGARWTMPTAPAGVVRSVYVFDGAGARIDDTEVAVGLVARVDGSVAVDVVAGPAATEILVLQGRPIGEPIVQHGPFVMNTATEIQQAFADYQRTQFGGWPWGKDDPVHAADAGRFARHADGRVERRDHKG